MSDRIQLYYHPFSNCSQRVLLLLEERGLAYEKRVINLLRSEQLTNDYLNIHPQGRVPAIVLGGKSYTESCDIMRFLEQRFPETSFMPSDMSARSIMDEFLDSAKTSHDWVKDYLYSKRYGRLPTDAELRIYGRVDPENAAFHHNRRAGLIGCDVDNAHARATE